VSGTEGRSEATRDIGTEGRSEATRDIGTEGRSEATRDIDTVPVLSVRGLVKAYHDRPVLNGIDLDVAEHQVVVLIGASGSGKSTLLRCVDLLEDIDDGQILLDGRDISDPRIDADAARQAMGMVFQSFNLFPHMTALANVALAPRVVHGSTRRDAQDRGRELLSRVGLSDHGDAYPDKLSGGQQQRVAIARALAYDPRLLLLDEITSALDPELVGEVLALVGELATSGRTIVMATHEMTFAREVADTVCFLDGGVIVESGPAEQVLTDPQHDRTRQFLRRFIGEL
jgi:polar amino acid transport system ATP-binding protein